jgi:protein gp37
MALNTKIEWTEATWNPMTGCSKASLGCKNCYAEKLAYRLQRMGNKKYSHGFEFTIHPEAFNDPLRWKKPLSIFVNSMSDSFHETCPEKYIQMLFRVMKEAKHHQFHVLTKRSKRMKDLSSKLSWTPNIWMGVTVESNEYQYRIEHLRAVPAKIKFLSFEPLLGPIQGLNLEGINWVIVGGESGTNSRPMKDEWVISIKDACRKFKIPFFFKQWGGFNKKKAGRTLCGRVWNEKPHALVGI